MDVPSGLTGFDCFKYSCDKNNINENRGENMKAKSDNEYLNEFEKLNTACPSIYDLGDYKVLIILKDGTNLTSWEGVENRDDVIYVSEDLSGFADLSHRYEGLESLKGIVAFGVTDRVESMDSMFYDCRRLEEISSLEGWDVSGVTDMEYMFSGCFYLEDISSLAGWDVSGVTDMDAMFWECFYLEDISSLAGWDVSGVTNMEHMFWECYNLEDLSALANWDVSGVSDRGWMFRGCSGVYDLYALAGWNVSGVTHMRGMFERCSGLSDLSALSMWDVSKVRIMRSMFDGCVSLKSLDGLENWNLASIITVERMFDGCSSLSDVSALKSWSLPDNANSGGIFNGCPEVGQNPLKKSVANKNGPLCNIDLNFKFLDPYGHGWCLVRLYDIYSRVSFLTEVPYDCLESIINAIKNDEDFEVVFNAEGWYFDVRADNEQCYFNFHAGERHAFDTINKYDLAIVNYNIISLFFKVYKVVFLLQETLK